MDEMDTVSRYTITNTRLPWTTQELSYLDAHKEDSINDIANTLHRSNSSVRNKLKRMGFIQTHPGRPWTQTEEDYLYRCYGRFSISVLANHLHRTNASVQHKAQSLGLVVYSEYWSLTLVAHAFQIDHRTLHKWHNKYGMPWNMTKHNGKPYYRIKEEKFWTWALANQDLIQWSRYVRGSLTGEPQELTTIIAQHLLPPRNNAPYRLSEIQRICHRYYTGDSIEVIARREGRSVEAIKHVLKHKEKSVV